MEGLEEREKGWMREMVRRGRLAQIKEKMKAQESQQMDEVMADDPSQSSQSKLG